MATPRNRLSTITKSLLAEKLDYTVIRNGVSQLKELFQEVTAFDEYGAYLSIDTRSGKAINTAAAAFCIMDMMRTRVFLRGIEEAVRMQLQQQPGKPVTVLYAGTGPFATLLTPLTTVFGPKELQLILLEINPASMECLEKTIRVFNMQPYILDKVLADAAAYHIPEAQQPDIILSETMNYALYKEPQVSIFANLSGQRPGAMLIPETITVEAALIERDDTGTNSRIIPMKMLLELNAATAQRISREEGAVAVLTEGIRVELPPLSYPVTDKLALLTRIKVFGEHTLSVNECGLTMPYPVLNIPSAGENPSALLFTYKRGAVPGFIVDTA